MPFTLSGIALLLGIAGAPPSADEVGVLRRNAEELLRQGQPSKALVLLQRARGLDSLQVGIDQLMTRCRAQMGDWVADGTGTEWMGSEENVQRIAERRPDSIFQVGKHLEESGNAPAALRIYQALVRLPRPDTAHLTAFAALRRRQDELVALHAGLAEQALKRGGLEDALDERRQALSIRPEDPDLALQVSNAEREVAVSREAFRAGLRRALQSSDASGAQALLVQALRAHPRDEVFRKSSDSLSERRKTFLVERIAEIGKWADAGRFEQALSAMDALVADNGADSGLAKAREAMAARVAGVRRRSLIDSAATGFRKVLEQGDLAGAQTILDGLRSQGLQGEEADRFARRIDSAMEARRSGARLDEAMAATRKALARGDTASARSWAQKALAVQPGNAMARNVLEGLAAKPRPAPVVATATPPAPPGKVDALVASGVAAYRNGEYKVAMEAWTQALAIDPGCVQADRYLQNVRRKQARLR